MIITDCSRKCLDLQALNLLLALVTSGALPPSHLAAIVAPPHFLSFIATLSVHPVLTTRARSGDRAEAASLASYYLKVVLESVGPIGSNLSDAFKFGSPALSSRRITRKGRRTNDAESPKNEHDDIVNDLAHVGSLWVCGEDLWHVIGWAFNCSFLHERRWDVWRDWTEYMIDVLEVDWNLRVTSASEDVGQSILVRHIQGETKVAGRDRRILRAVFADGTGRAANEFREVWPNETKELKREGDLKKAEKKIDIEADDYGDYMDEDHEADFEDSPESSGPRSRSPTKRGRKGGANNALHDTNYLGDVDSLHLRLRILALLSQVSVHAPQCFISTRGLYDILLEHIRPLPLSAFALIICPAGLRYFSVSAASSLTQYILLTIISANAPQPPSDHLNQEVLEQCYLPWEANSAGVVENAKVSLCVETLLRLLDKEGALEGTESLLKAAENGVKARRNKLNGRRGKGGRQSGGETAGDLVWLDGSAQRIRAVVKIATRRTKQESETKDLEAT